MPPDDLWRDSAWPNVIEEENKREREKQKEETSLKIAIRLCDGIISLQGHTAFKDYVETLQDMKKFRMAELLGAVTDRKANVLTGQCLEIQGILGVMNDTRNRRETLAGKLALVQAELTEIRKQRPSEAQA